MTIRPGSERSILGRWCNKAVRCAVAAVVCLLLPAAWAQSPALLGKAYRSSPTPARRRALERFAVAHRDINGALARLTLGVVSFEQGQYPDAIRHLEAARGRLPRLADYTAYYLAAARIASQDYANAARDAAAVRTAPVRSPFAAKSMVLEARGMAASGSAAQAITLLDAHRAELPEPDGDLALATAYEAANDRRQAAEYYQRVYYAYPGGDAADQAAAALVNLRTSMGASYPAPSPEALVGRARNLLTQGEYRRARAEFEALVPQLSGPERDRARVGVGAAQYLAGDVSAAYSELRSLEVSDSDAGAERLYYLAECARKLNDDDQMMEAVRDLGRRYAGSLWRYRALVTAANRYLVENQYQKYTPLYRAVYESFPDQPLAAICHWHVAWSAYIHRQPDARELLREHVEKYPGYPSATAALYFLGRLAEERRDYAAARAFYNALTTRFPNYYYGILARQRMEQAKIAPAGESATTAQFLRLAAFPPRRPVIASRPDADTMLRIARARLLKAAGLENLAQRELRFGARTGRQPYLLAMEAARIASTPHERLHDIKNAAPDYLSMSLRDAPPAFWRLLFPLPYERDLLRDARRQKLDPYMIAALIRQESEFDPQALSGKRAYGLMQVQPATGRSLARHNGLRRLRNRALFQPAVNLRIGTYYLRALLDRWGGKWEEALAAYNAGQSRVSEWVTWNTYQEPAEFVESIPFGETREYVEAVLRNATVYRELYAEKAKSTRSHTTPRRQAGRTRRSATAL